MNKLLKKIYTSKAQAVVELAIFGAILIFVIGSIVRQAMGFAYQQNQILKAMRVAMSASYKSSQAGNASRNSANVIYVEDRLTAHSAKYGAIDRTPYILGGRASHTKQLFLPVESGEYANLQRSDIYINGVHIPLLSQNFKRVCLTHTKGECASLAACAPAGRGCKWAGPYDGFTKVWEPNCVGGCVATNALPKGCDCSTASSCQHLVNPCDKDAYGNLIDPTCVDGVVCAECTAHVIGCVEFRTTAINVPACRLSPAKCPVLPAWCDDTIPCSPNNLPAEKRFDLDRDGIADSTGGTIVVGSGISDVNRSGNYPTWKEFSWQWYKVMNYDEVYAQGQDIGAGATFDSYGRQLTYSSMASLMTGEGFIWQDPAHPSDENAVQAKNIFIDVDGDLKRERIVGVSHENGSPIPTTIMVIDNQDGDMDYTYNTRDYLNYKNNPLNPLYKPKSEITQDVKMYTFVNEGTYLLIEEGKLFGNGRQYVRQTQKKDQIDLIERRIQLANDTGRFCSGGVPRSRVDGMANPVEACNNCFSSANIAKTCMDTGDLSANPPRHPSIFVRSRIENKRGRRWVTDTSADQYIDVQTQ